MFGHCKGILFRNMSHSLALHMPGLLTLPAQCHALIRETAGWAGELGHTMPPSDSPRTTISSDGFLSTDFRECNKLVVIAHGDSGKFDAETADALPGSIINELPPAIGQLVTLLSNLTKKSIDLQHQLQCWHDALLPIADSHTRTAASLLTHYHACRLWLSTRLEIGVKVFDQYSHEFQEILR